MALNARYFKVWFKRNIYPGMEITFMCKCNNSGCGCNTKKLDFSKPVRTKDGRQVRIVCTDGPDTNFPVIGIIQGERFVNYWNFNGNDPSLLHRDLVNVEPEVFYYMNIYERTPGGELYATTHLTTANADHSKGVGRVGKMKIKLEKRSDW